MRHLTITRFCFATLVISLPYVGVLAAAEEVDQPQELESLPRLEAISELDELQDVSEDYVAPVGLERSTWDRLGADGDSSSPDSGQRRRGSLAERLQQVRRRTVDDQISRPFDGQLDRPDVGGAPTVDSENDLSFETGNATAEESSEPREEVLPVEETPEVQDESSDLGLSDESVVAESTPHEPSTGRSTRPLSPIKTTAIEPESTPIGRNGFSERNRDDDEGSERNERDLLVSNRAPSLSFETIGPKTVTVGRPATYHVDMLNTGDVDGRNLIVAVRIPPWAELVGHKATVGTPNLEADIEQNTVVRWSIGSLEARSKERLSLRITPRDSRPFDLAVGWALAPGQSMTQITVQEPKLDMHISGPSEVHYGETQSFSITLSNPGNGLAENVVLSLLPAGTGQGPVGSREIGDLKAGERKTVELELTAHQAGQLQIRAMASAEGDLKTESELTVQVRRANLVVHVEGPTHAYADSATTYRLMVENRGDAVATETTLVAALPVGAHFVAGNAGGQYDEETNAVQWVIGSMRPGSHREFELNCVVQSAGTNRLEAEAVASGDLKSEAAAVTTVEAVADLQLVVNDPQGPVNVGEDAYYEVKVINRGSETARGIDVVGFFSHGIEPITVSGWRGDIVTGQVNFDTIEQLGPGKEIVIRVVARAHQPGNHVFRTELACATPETRLASEDSTNFYGEQRTTLSRPSTEATSPAASPYPVRNGPMLRVDALR